MLNLRRFVVSLLGLLATLSPLYAADMSKTLRFAFVVAESGFDPQANSDVYSANIMNAIFDPLYELDYLARPPKFIPRAAEAMPVMSDDGKTWTIKIKQGMYYADDPAFKGKKREVTAQDYVFGIQRIFDPKVICPYVNNFEGMGILGMNEALAAARAGAAWNYDAEYEGLKALDKYTLQIKTKERDHELMNYLGFYVTTAVPREVWDAYKDNQTRIQNNPVGSGPYYLKEWKRASKMVLEANPNYRKVVFRADDAEPGDKALVEAMKGKTLPIIGRIEVTVIEESNPRLLAFKSNLTDILDVPTDLVDNVVQGGKLVSDLADKNVQWARALMPILSYSYFNMEDPVIGGYTKEKIALRRALIMAFNTEEQVKVMWKGHAEPAPQIIPPPLLGHDKAYKGRHKHDPELANALLDRFGYKDCDGDGFRELPGCQPLVITKSSTPRDLDRQEDELWQKAAKSIKVKIQFNKAKWPDLLKEGKAGKLQFWGVGWNSAMPDGTSFPRLLYSKSIGQSNYSQFKNAEFDALFEQAVKMPHSPERTALFRKMNDIVNAYSVWENGIYRYENTLAQPWVVGFKKHPFVRTPWWMYDIDKSKLPKS